MSNQDLSSGLFGTPTSTHTPASVSFNQLPPTSFDKLDANSDPFTQELSSDQHPMIPLPPGVWAGLIALGAISWHAVRQQRGTSRR